MSEMNYDPNLVCSGKFANQKVKLTFGQWDYRAEIIAEVGGNCMGMTVIESAVEDAYDRLPTVHSYNLKYLSLHNKNGDVLECPDDCDEGDDWLAKMLVAAEIISIEPEE
ncbi:DUF5406 family protein [Mixta mediterraneensis]|uniref:DUF5406 family protein n=1 Tax=Mixta mediterraneensis TaxID=2758443 RepID=UPI00187545E4|nr:DUF5406 family protein [Mixta mediterraneensis]MBE5254567.1 DUF5406 family protein [Mixta mediterraneensis]